MNLQAREVLDRVGAFIADKDDAWSMPIEAMRFLHGVVLAHRPTLCVEIGTSYGHSGLWIASALAMSGGRLVTIDHEQRKSDIAAGFFAEAGLSDVVSCRTGSALEILEEIPGPIDFALNDADKENAGTYVEMLHTKMPVGGVILTDNVTSHEEVRERLSSWVRNDERFCSALVAVGNGLEMTVKVA